jgi:hypothetical protein
MINDTYVTPQGTEFEFGFEFKDGNYRIHILQQPNYNGRPEGGHSTHRIATDSGHIICWTGAMPTIASAKTIAGLWADHTENYILNGEPFPTNEG